MGQDAPHLGLRMRFQALSQLGVVAAAREGAEGLAKGGGEVRPKALRVSQELGALGSLQVQPDAALHF